MTCMVLHKLQHDWSVYCRLVAFAFLRVKLSLLLKMSDTSHPVESDDAESSKFHWCGPGVLKSKITKVYEKIVQQ